MSPKLLTLATPCAVCPHPYNWHTPGGCQADDGTNRCSCRAFAVAADQEQQPETAADRVRKLHPSEIGNEYGDLECSTCREVYPCPTIRALDTPETRRA